MPDDKNVYVCTCGYMTYDRIAMLDHTIHHLNKRIKKLKRQLNQAKKVKKEVEDLKRLLEKGKQNG